MPAPIHEYEGHKCADGTEGDLPPKRGSNFDWFDNPVAPASSVVRKQNQRIEAQAGNPNFPTKRSEK